MSFNVGQLVELTDKKVRGKIAHLGTTQFATGEWIGIILDEPKGRNNGTVNGVTYFNCEANYGVFVKMDSPTIRLLDALTDSITEDKTGSNSSLASHASTTSTASSKLKRPEAYGSRNNVTKGKTFQPKSATITKVNTRTEPSRKISTSSNQSKEDEPQQANQTMAFQPLTTTNIKSISRPMTTVDTSSPFKTMATNVSINVQQQVKTAENVDLLKNEIKDLNEKLESVKKKLVDEKEKNKEFEKTKMHLQQLQEFKKQITESHAELNRQLQQAKREAKEAIEEKLRHADEMKDLSETAEIATLDKEMAEEKYEMLLREFEQAKEKLEETTLDYELLKSRIEEQGTGAVVNDHQLAQLEQQNIRLREACMKLKNLSDQEKNEMQKLKKEFDTLLNEKSNLEKFKERTHEEITTLENQITDLKEQIDFNLGSQEMVEILTEKNLKQEDKIRELEDNILQLEEIYEINEQLQETAREAELELKEELDTMVVKLNEMQKKYEENQENLAEYESTIQKLRDIVSKLKHENEQLKVKNTTDQTNREEEKQKLSQAENIQFKMRFAEAKVFSRAIEMDLRRLEVRQANEYIKYLLMFMPESFFIRGGDDDAIQILLFAPRMIFKLHVISRQIQEKFPLNTELEDKLNSLFIYQENEAINQQFFVRKLLFILSSIEFVLDLFLDALESCPLELYLKIASLLPELSSYEKIVDNSIDLLRRDQFDETISLDGLEKVLNYFISIFSIHLTEAKVTNSTKMLTNFNTMIQQSVNSAYFNTLIIKNCLNLSSDAKFDFFNKLINSFIEIKSLSKKIKRRLAGDQKIKLTPAIENEIRECSFELNKTINTLSNLREKILKEFIENDCPSSKKEEDIIFLNLDTFLKHLTNLGGSQFIEDTFSSLVNLCTQVTSGLQQGDYDEENSNSLHQQEEQQLYSISSLNSLDVKNPLKQRAEYIKAQSGEVNDLKIKLEAEQAEVGKLTKLLKAKNDDWQEMKIRKDLFERKLQVANQEADERIARLQNELDDLTNTLKRKEKENEETMNHLQADIDALESEKGDLKEKIKQLSRKSLEGINRSSTTSITNNVSALSSSSSNTLSSNISQTTSNLSAIESSYILQMKILKQALKQTNDKLYDLKCKQSLSKFKELKVSNHKPIWLLRLENKLNSNEQKENEDPNVKDNYNVELFELLKRVRNLEKETTITLLEETKIDRSKSIILRLRERDLKKKIIAEKYRNLEEDIKSFRFKYFDFIGNDMNNIFNNLINQNSSSKLLAAKIELPNRSKQTGQNVFSFQFTLNQLKEIHQKIF